MVAGMSTAYRGCPGPPGRRKALEDAKAAIAGWLQVPLDAFDVERRHERREEACISRDVQ